MLSFTFTPKPAPEVEMSKLGVIEVEGDGECAFCKKVDELRPYGPRGERICFDCGMENPETAKRQMGRYIYGDNIN